MANIKEDRRAFEANVRDMTEKERLSAIEEVEDARFEVVYQIEAIMKELSLETKNKRYRSRKYKLGKSPNDYSKA